MSKWNAVSSSLTFRCIFTTTGLDLTQLAKTTNGGAHSDGSGGGRSVGSSGGDLVAAKASPDSNVGTLHGVLTAELARVLGVLSNFDLADLLTDGGTIASSVLSDDSNLLSSATLQIRTKDNVEASFAFKQTRNKHKQGSESCIQGQHDGNEGARNKRRANPQHKRIPTAPNTHEPQDRSFSLHNRASKAGREAG